MTLQSWYTSEGGTILQTGVLSLIALGWLKLVEGLTKRSLISMELSRKSVHVGIGVLFLVCWGLYPPACSNCRYFAALIPAAILFKFLAIAMGLIRDPNTVKMLCRDGSASQLLYGPALYGLVIVWSTIVFWTDGPLGPLLIILL
jgi:farnesol kinase